ncbi:MAG TPA: phosphoribosyltransferase family protein [Thermoanaerobaculia bacterium]|nr:phosphoribosyltransferase family protein [Thermoanaerobaculia bacterium]
MLFANREQAARRLAERLTRYRGQNPLILAIPRGAVPMGRILAEALDGELDVALVRKIGAPGNPEFAIGSVAENGEIVVREWARNAGISEDYIEREARRQLATLMERRKLYTPGRHAVDVAGRVAIVLDDGVATGSTMLAALELARTRAPRRLIAATAVAPRQTLERLQGAADEVVCLASPDPFQAVSLFFDDFSQVTDGEVIDILAADHDRTAMPVPSPS